MAKGLREKSQIQGSVARPTDNAQKEHVWSLGKPVQILQPDGQLVPGHEEPELSREALLAIYRWMVAGRHFDERALRLQRQGRLGTYAPFSGQEAAQVGSAYALKKEDWFFPSYREHLALVLRGQPWLSILLYWGGNEEGGRAPEGVNNFTPSIPIATQILHAVGTAWAAKIKGDPIVTLVCFGDGGTSEGDFHEGMNFAGVFQTPTIFFCQNNQYAISVPRARQTRAETLAQKAIAYGFEGIQVDGNDVLAVYETTRRAAEKARGGGGPTLIEAITYRYGPHTTADDPTRYRKDEEVKRWQEEKDPITRLRHHLERKGSWDDQKDAALQGEIKAEIAQQIDEYLKTPERDVEEIFKYTYAEMPWNLQEQLTDLRAYLKESGGHLPE